MVVIVNDGVMLKTINVYQLRHIIERLVRTIKLHTRREKGNTRMIGKNREEKVRGERLYGLP